MTWGSQELGEEFPYPEGVTLISPIIHANLQLPEVPKGTF